MIMTEEEQTEVHAERLGSGAKNDLLLADVIIYRRKDFRNVGGDQLPSYQRLHYQRLRKG
jgi:hypothetical protein